MGTAPQKLLRADLVTALGTRANSICEQDRKHVISAEHVLRAVKELGWQAWLPELEEALSDLKESSKGRQRSALLFMGSGNAGHNVGLPSACCVQFASPKCRLPTLSCKAPQGLTRFMYVVHAGAKCVHAGVQAPGREQRLLLRLLSAPMAVSVACGLCRQQGQQEHHNDAGDGVPPLRRHALHPLRFCAHAASF